MAKSAEGGKAPRNRGVKEVLARVKDLHTCCNAAKMCMR